MIKRLFFIGIYLAAFCFASPDIFAEGTEQLGPPTIQIASGSGFVEDGVGLYSQPGTVMLDVPSGATIKQVLVYWEGQHDAPGNGDNTIIIESIEVTGSLIGGPTLFFGAADGSHYTSSYRADITSLNLVSPGANILTLEGLNFGFNPPRNNGAGVLVIYDDGTDNELFVRDGNDNAYKHFTPPLHATVPQLFTFTPEETGRTAHLTLFVGSVRENESRPNMIEITVNGSTTQLVNLLSSDDGLQWDTPTIPVPIPAGASDLKVEVFSYDDGSGNQPASLTWVMTALSLPAVTKASLPHGRMTGGGSVFTTGGMRVTHGFQLHCDKTQKPNRLQINWGKGNRFHLEALISATCTDDPNIDPGKPAAPFDTYEGQGTGRYNGKSGATAEWTFTDAGEPGVNDRARIVIRDASGNVVLTVDGYLNKGNHQAHKSKDKKASKKPAPESFSSSEINYNISQNYPNPFNPSTQIAYSIPEAGDISLIIYNTMGQVVRVLAQGYHAPGAYQVTWNGKDAVGRAVASGVYFYQFTSQKLVKTQRMMLLK